ncbi:MAG: energy transducer TonB [Cyanobacteria bacterium P01_A01_bin.83]
MSYESQLEDQSGKLINPAKLCLLLSVALHLLVLKFGLPSIRFNNDSGSREVGFIELNPEQQAQLPNLYPQLETPDIPDLGSLPELDNSEPAAPFAIPRDLIPGIGNSDNLPPLTIPPPPQFNLPPLPPVTDITLPPLGDLSTLPLPPEIDLSDFKVEPIKLPPNVGATPQKPPEAAQPEQPIEQPEAQPTETEQEPEAKPQATPQQIAAQKVAASGQRIRNLRQSLSKNEAGTSDEDARKNYIAWLTKVQAVEPEKIEIAGTYPRDACIKKLEGSSIFGVVVNPAGEVISLDLIKGATYPIFNQQASKDLSDRILPNDTGKPQPYQVKIDYEYDSDICPSLGLPLRRAEEPEPEKQQPAPQPEVKPEPTPQVKPKPEAKPEPTPQVKPEPQPEVKPEPQPEPKPQPVPEPVSEPVPEPAPEPAPELEPLPSLRDRLKDVPLPDTKPADLKDIPLPERPNFNN